MPMAEMHQLRPRIFEDNEAKREVNTFPVGIAGPSYSGKTYSALRVAVGAQRVLGGDIAFIDTENKRALDYADDFKFRHIPFPAPFGSLDYLAAITQCVKKGYKVVITDSMTHEHIGPGGYHDVAQRAIQAIAKGDEKKAERAKLTGWAAAQAPRQQMIEGIKQLDGFFIFCWRAKSKTKPNVVIDADGNQRIKGVKHLGYMPIGGEEWPFEMKIFCMLPPGSMGVPIWRSYDPGTQGLLKLPEWAAPIFAEGKALDEIVGQAFAEWMVGKKRSELPRQQGPAVVRGLRTEEAPEMTLQEEDALTADGMITQARDRAKAGSDALQQWWKALTHDRPEWKDLDLDEAKRVKAEVVRLAGELKGAPSPTNGTEKSNVVMSRPDTKAAYDDYVRASVGRLTSSDAIVRWWSAQDEIDLRVSLGIHPDSEDYKRAQNIVNNRVMEIPQ